MRFVPLIISISIHLVLITLSFELEKKKGEISFATVPLYFVSSGTSPQEVRKSMLTRELKQDLDTQRVENHPRFEPSNVASLTTEQIVKFGNQLPHYPEEAVEHGWEGTVLLELRLNAEGKVILAKILESSGFYLLDRVAREASQDWKFESMLPGSVVVAPIKFKIES